MSPLRRRRWPAGSGLTTKKPFLTPTVPRGFASSCNAPAPGLDALSSRECTRLCRAIDCGDVAFDVGLQRAPEIADDEAALTGRPQRIRIIGSGAARNEPVPEQVRRE
jgi:hypothetical protein